MNPAIFSDNHRSLKEGGAGSLPQWFRQELPGDKALSLARELKESGIHTVCQEAKCPNVSGCFNKNNLTFIILGNVCSRNCRFCAVQKAQVTKKLIIDTQEPERIAEVVKKLGMTYVVITSVTRDDLVDGGAEIFARTIKSVRAIDNSIRLEVLIPDLKGSIDSLKIIIDAGPNVVAHNIETVAGLYPEVRPMADYRLSLGVIENIKRLNPDIISKSSIMLGLGETRKEVIEAMRDLRQAHCDILVLGQYLAPSINHYPVKRFVSPTEFDSYKEIATEIGFKAVFSAPLARSSFRAGEIFEGELIHV